MGKAIQHREETMKVRDNVVVFRRQGASACEKNKSGANESNKDGEKGSNSASTTRRDELRQKIHARSRHIDLKEG